MVQLTKFEQQIFTAAHNGNWDAFTEPMFRLPESGTWYTPHDRVDEYVMIYEVWRVIGRPGEQFHAEVNEQQVLYKVFWLPENEGEPAFLFPHGYLFLDWAKIMLGCGKMVFVAEGGTGAGKTSQIGIAALMKCALYGGFDFLNVAPTATQADDMLDEIVKWTTDSPFGRRFVKRTRDGELFLKKPYPTMTIDAGMGAYSTFGCMTLGKHGDTILGKGKDWINIDEASLVLEVGESIPRLITRYRGTRRTGMPRFARPAFSLITNPHINFSFDRLREKAETDMEKGGKVYHFEHLVSRDNRYITESQLAVQESIMDSGQKRRWLDGDRDVFATQGMLPAIIIEECHAPYLDDLVKKLVDDEDIYEFREDMEIIHYELPYEEGREYLVAGDPGSANAVSLNTNNVPVSIVLDTTDFPHGRAILVALRLIDGGGKYAPWVEYTKYLMNKYRCGACYDATSTQKSFLEYGFENYPNVYPVNLGGGNKATARTMFQLFAGDGLFAWPKIRVIWHQAAAYRERGVGVSHIPDDVTAALFVASFYLRAQFYDALAEMFKWDKTEDNTAWETLQVGRAKGRYLRGRGGRYDRR